MINFKTSHPHKKERKRKEEDVICLGCIKSVHYQTCMNLNKHNKKKDKYSYNTNGRYAKGHKAYIIWEEKNEISSSSSISNSNDEGSNMCLMMHKKSEDTNLYSFDL